MRFYRTQSMDRTVGDMKAINKAITSPCSKRVSVCIQCCSCLFLLFGLYYSIYSEKKRIRVGKAYASHHTHTLTRTFLLNQAFAFVYNVCVLCCYGHFSFILLLFIQCRNFKQQDIINLIFMHGMALQKKRLYTHHHHYETNIDSKSLIDMNRHANF